LTIRIGEKIKNLRLASDLTQQDLAERAGLTKGFISQLERNLTSISLGSLEDILKALNISLSEFFSDPPTKQVIFSEEERRDLEQNGVGSFEWLVPGATNRNMEPALVTLAPGEITQEIEPFSGEEFGFVLAGRVMIRLGHQTYRAKRGDSFYFSADRHHQIKNIGKVTARFLWITCPPYF